MRLPDEMLYPAGTRFAKNKSYAEALRWAIADLAQAISHLQEAGETADADHIRRLRSRLAIRRRKALAK